MFMDWNIHYSENEYTTQSNLQIQCSPYQVTNSIFQRTRTNNFTICMEIQKPRIAKALLRKDWNWRNQPTWLQTVQLQSLRQYGTGTKTSVYQWNKIGSPEINLCTYRHLIFDKGGKNIEQLLLLPSCFSRVQLFVTPQMAVHQAPPSL